MARAATGAPVVAGAPNLLRGGSHTGNVSASELVAAGLVTAVDSDYLPSGLVAAAFGVAERGLVDLPTAVALVTSGPADAAGLTDRGRLVPGARADLALVSPASGARRWPAVRRVLRAG